MTQTSFLGDKPVGRIGFGAMQLAGPGVFGPPRDPDAARAVLRRAIELGVDHIDTSQYYGPDVVNDLIRETLHPYPENLKLVTKVGARRDETGAWLPALSPAELRQGIEDNLRALRVERMDLVNLRVIGEHGGELPFGEVGELVGRSTHLMLRYHNRPEATSELIWRSPDGLEYLRTGDLGTIDPDGWVTIRGRKKDMIKSGGLNVFPADIEPVLLAHEAVGECAVVGVPDPKWGETPVGFVVLSDGQAAGTGAIQEWVNERVEKTQRLRDVVIVSELPRNSIGKVIKGELRDQYGGTPVRSHRL